VEQLQQLSLKTNKELALLKEQQLYIESAPLELKVAVAHMEQAKKEQAELEKKIKVLNSTVRDAENKITDLNKDYELTKNTILIRIDEENDKVRVLKINNTELTNNLKQLNKEINARKKYYDDQEELIANTEQAASESFEALQNRHTQLERSISTLESDKIKLTQEIVNLTLDKDKLESQFTDTVLKQEDQMEQAKKDLLKIQSEVSEAEMKYKSFSKAVDARKNELRAEAEAIDAKLDALHREESEFRVAKRRNASPDINFEL